MEQSKVEIIGKYVSNSQKSRFRVEQVMVDEVDKTTCWKPNSLDMTKNSFTKTMIQVYQRLRLYQRAKLTITITEMEE